MAVLVPFYLSMYNNIIEVIFMTNIDQLDKILQSLSTELQKNKEIEDLKQIDDKFMENVILDLNSEFNNDKIIIPRLKAELISYEKQRRYWLNKRIELKQFIINLNIKDKIKQVLILRFIELKKRREISDILHYSLSYIDRLLKRGLFFIDEKLKSSSQKVVI